MTCRPCPNRLVPEAYGLLKRFWQKPTMKSSTVSCDGDADKNCNYDEFSYKRLHESGSLCLVVRIPVPTIIIVAISRNGTPSSSFKGHPAERLHDHS
jgi:hypothetical protein